MHYGTWAAISVLGFAVSGCAALMDSPSSGQDRYGAPGYAERQYYGAPAPYYVAPYPYQPDYGDPYSSYGQHAGRRDWQEHGERDHRQEHDERDRRPNQFQNQGGQQFDQQHRQFIPAQAPAAPPPVARPQASQNQKLIDQLGFKPSR